MVISVVVPCFNEEESIPLFYEEMERVQTFMGEEFEYIFINDGSSDKTLDVLRELNLLESLCPLSFFFTELWERSSTLCWA